MVFGVGVDSGLRVIHVATAGISILAAITRRDSSNAASGCVEGFGYDGFEGKRV